MPKSRSIENCAFFPRKVNIMSKQARKSVVKSMVRVNGQVLPVRFVNNGRAVRVTSRGMPRLTLRQDLENKQVIVRHTSDGVQTTERWNGTNMARAFSQAVATFWN